MKEKRYSELDALRGLAVILMVLYHAAFNLELFYGWDTPVGLSLWSAGGRSIGTLFLLLVGICFRISWERSRTQIIQRSSDKDKKVAGASRACGLVGLWPTEENTELASKHAISNTSLSKRHQLYPKYFRRGVIIFGGGMLVTFFTWLIAPRIYVKFGILHLIGVSALLQPLFVRCKQWNALIGIILFFLGAHFLSLETESTLLFPFGVMYETFASLDYYPLLPWFGIILIGMALGEMSYIPEPKKILAPLQTLPYPKLLLACGRYSLWIYFIHQPLLLLALLLVLGKPTISW